jgi:hypothetical protein
MKRVDVFDENNDMVAGICLFHGRLICCEGSKKAAHAVIEGTITIPGPSGEIVTMRPIDDPVTWLEKWVWRSFSPYMPLGDVRDDDDEMYDPNTGFWIGEESLMTDEKLTALENSE